MTVTEALKQPTARVVVLAEITAGVWVREWLLNGVFVNSYTISMPDEVTAVRWNRTTLLTQRGHFVDVNNNQSSWYWDRNTQLLWVRPPTGQSMYTNTIQAVVGFWFAHPEEKVLNSRFYDPRLLTAPALSKRIEAMFGDIAQIGGGQIVLANIDGYFNAKQRYQWNAGTVTLKMGVDTPAGDMAWADYETVATWTVEEWSRDESNFTLRLVEAKTKLKSKVPFTFYTRAAYPNINDDLVGKAIPIVYGTVYGAPATLIDPGLRKFKVAGHEIYELSEVRLLKTFEESKDRTISAAAWYAYTTDVWRYYLPDEEARSVTFNGTAIVEAENLDDCIATANRWYSEDNFVYVRPATGNDMGSGTYVIQTAKTLNAWDNVNFATKDLANGEFTLSDEWTIGQEVSVDLKGKRSSGALVENSVTIIEDLLTLVGATNLDAASFTAAKAKLVLGTTITGRTRHTRSVSLYLSDPQEVTEILGEVLEQIGGYLYSDKLGQYTIGIFEPEPGETLAVIDDQEIVDFTDNSATKDIITTVNQRYAIRDKDEFAQNLQTTNTVTRYLNDQPENVVKEVETTFAADKDARDYAQRTLVYHGAPLRTVTVRTPWTQWLRQPGEQVHIVSTRFGVDEILEVLEIRTDLSQKQVSLTLGNLRAFEDRPGFWVDASATLPTRFAPLAGYGAGSLTWNTNWATDIKVWARQNVGYWLDANGFVNTADPYSLIPSCWV